MYKICFLLLIGIILSIGNTFAQEILPKFTIKELDGKISISWRNNYPKEVKGINIQRSYDSIKRFSTIATVPNPKIIANGFIDKHPPYNKMYYRLFIVFDSGLYVFSESQRPYTDSLPGITETEDNAVKKPGYTRKNSLPALVTEKKIQGSVLNDSKSVKKPFEKLKSKENPVLPPKETIFIYPSKRIYTGKDNNIVINLPEIKSNKYVIKFFDDENNPLFELNKITEDYLIIEKMNFMHSGWFKFEIYENDKLLEKNKFMIPKDGKNQ